MSAFWSQNQPLNLNQLFSFHTQAKNITKKKLTSTTKKNTYHLHPPRGKASWLPCQSTQAFAAFFVPRPSPRWLYFSWLAWLPSRRSAPGAWVKFRMDDVWWMLWREMFGEVFLSVFVEGNFKMCLCLGIWVEGLHKSPQTSVDWICVHTFYMKKAERIPIGVFLNQNTAFGSWIGFGFGGLKWYSVAWLAVGDMWFFGEPWGCFIELCGKLIRQPPQGLSTYLHLSFQRLWAENASAVAVFFTG